MPSIKLQSSDGKVFEVDLEIAKASTTITTMLEDLGVNDDDKEVVPVHNIRSELLEKVIEWATYHRNDPPPTEEDDETEIMKTDISEWDKEFFSKVDVKTLFELCRAADYLNIKGLIDVSCKTVANMIKNKTSEEIRDLFNLRQIMAENKLKNPVAPSTLLESPSTST